MPRAANYELGRVEDLQGGIRQALPAILADAEDRQPR